MLEKSPGFGIDRHRLRSGLRPSLALGTRHLSVSHNFLTCEGWNSACWLGLLGGHGEHVVLAPGAERAFGSYWLFRGKDGPKGALDSPFFPPFAF